jgi:hypothetical protein
VDQRVSPGAMVWRCGSIERRAEPADSQIGALAANKPTVAFPLVAGEKGPSSPGALSPADTITFVVLHYCLVFLAFALRKHNLIAIGVADDSHTYLMASLH